MDDNKYVMGRGKVSIGGEYIGNTPEFSFVPNLRDSDAPIRLKIVTDNISDDNLERYFKARKMPFHTKIGYEARNAAGRNIDFEFPKVLLKAGFFRLKSGEEWMSMTYFAEIVPVNGKYFTYTKPVTVQV